MKKQIKWKQEMMNFYKVLHNNVFPVEQSQGKNPERKKNAVRTYNIKLHYKKYNARDMIMTKKNERKKSSKRLGNC